MAAPANHAYTQNDETGSPSSISRQNAAVSESICSDTSDYPNKPSILNEPVLKFTLAILSTKKLKKIMDWGPKLKKKPKNFRFWDWPEDDKNFGCFTIKDLSKVEVIWKNWHNRNNKLQIHSYIDSVGKLKTISESINLNGKLTSMSSNKSSNTNCWRFADTGELLKVLMSSFYMDIIKSQIKPEDLINMHLTKPKRPSRKRKREDRMYKRLVDKYVDMERGSSSSSLDTSSTDVMDDSS